MSTPISWLLSAIIVAVLAFVWLVLIGLRVVRRYPVASDTRRNAKKYTRPAAYLVIVIVVCLVIAIISGIIAIVT